MDEGKEYSDHGFSGILLILAFFIFLVVYSGNAAAQTPVSERHPVTQTIFAGNGNHIDATLTGAGFSVDHQKILIEGASGKGLPLFSIKNRLTDFDHMITRSYLHVCRERLRFEPDMPLIIRNKVPSRSGTDIPVLS